MKTPVVLLIFNRPDTTQKVFEKIRQAQPPQLLVVADGARSDRPREAEQCQAARAIIKNVDWECEVLTNYSEVNLGCQKRVSSGLNWVFDLVEEAIILEDDCLPDPSFFPFCEQLLDYYRHDNRIGVISGQNVQLGKARTNYSYYFSRYNHCWGWASWRRAWQDFDFEMQLWTMVKETGWLEDILLDAGAVKFWNHLFESTYRGEINSWAIRWTFSCWMQNYLTVLSNHNLISNIGFDTGSTHTSKINQFTNLPTKPVKFPLQHPPFVIRDSQADRFTQRIFYSTNPVGNTKRAIKKILKKTPLKTWL